MIEFTTTEFVLLCVSGVAVAAALHYREMARKRGELLHGAAVFTRKLVEDDEIRDELRKVIKAHDDADIRFGEK